jgi:hypothetical protein
MVIISFKLETGGDELEGPLVNVGLPNPENLPMDKGLHDLHHCSNFVFEVRVEYFIVREPDWADKLWQVR